MKLFLMSIWVNNTEASIICIKTEQLMKCMIESKVKYLSDEKTSYE